MSSSNNKVTVKSKVRISVNPNKITKGQMLNVSAEIFDSITGVPLVFDRIYMQIIDKDGKEVWPLSTIEVNSSQINKLISTSEMKKGRYTVRISPSKKLSPMAAYSFEIEDTTPLAAVPLIPLVLLAVPSGVRRENVEKEFVGPLPPPKVEWVIWRTKIDGRVCTICLPFEGLLFRADDPEMLRVGPPELGGDSHWGCRCNLDVVTDKEIRKMFFDAQMREFNAQQAELEEIHEIYQVSLIAQTAFKQMENIKK